MLADIAKISAETGHTARRLCDPKSSIEGLSANKPVGRFSSTIL